MKKYFHFFIYLFIYYLFFFSNQFYQNKKCNKDYSTDLYKSLNIFENGKNSFMFYH